MDDLNEFLQRAGLIEARIPKSFLAYHGDLPILRSSDRGFDGGRRIATGDGSPCLFSLRWAEHTVRGVLAETTRDEY